MISSIAFLKGLAFGIAAAMPIGPVNLEIIRRGLLHHPLMGAALGCGAVTADLTYLTLSFLGISVLLERYPAIGVALQCGGGLLLLFLGYLAIRSSSRRAILGQAELAARPQAAPDGWRRAARTYGLGVLMTALNPMTIGVWASLSTEVLAMAGAEAGRGAIFRGLLLGTLCGAGGWVVFLTGLLFASRRAVGPRFLRAVSLVGGICLLGFGALMLLRALVA